MDPAFVPPQHIREDYAQGADLQSKLLRVIQEGNYERVGEDRTRTVNVRLISATNRDLERESSDGRFRLDLYYRISVFLIEIPPLRERREDIVPWQNIS